MNVLVRALQEGGRIRGFCPCCGADFRLSDLRLYTRTRPPKTEFDRIEEQRERHQRRVDDWEYRREELRAGEVQRGRREARAHVKRIAPFLVKRNIEPKDVRPLFTPIRYVVFQGLADNEPRAVYFVDCRPSDRRQEKLQNSILRAIHEGNLEWRTLRVGDDGRVVDEKK